MTPPTVCLCMIVKNEAPVLARCLESVRPLISCYVICDTGSTDETMEIAREALGELSGDVFARPWVNFAVNRTEALQRAYKRADYVLIIDADEVLKYEPGFRFPPLDRHAYYLRIESGDIVYPQTRLLDNSLPWEYKGVLHEYPYSPEASTEGTLAGFTIIRYPDGARARDPLTYRKDALVLEKALIEEPENSRYTFYLAQSYRDAGNYERAIFNYRIRVNLGGWEEEIFYSLYQIAELRYRRGDPFPEVLADYLAAYAFRPVRAEPLYRIGLHYSHTREYRLAYFFLHAALEIPYPVEDRLFVEAGIYHYFLALETAVAAYYLGEDAEAIDLYDTILCDPELPPHIRALAERNLAFSLDRSRSSAPPPTGWLGRGSAYGLSPESFPP